MAYSVELDGLTEMMVAHLVRVMETEPPRPDNTESALLTEELAIQHYAWSRDRDAIRLLLGHQLVNLVMEQHPLKGIPHD